MDLAIKRGANGYRIGDSHPRTEYTDHEIELMRQMRDSGLTVADLARLWEASKGYVSKVCNYRIRRGGR